VTTSSEATPETRVETHVETDAVTGHGTTPASEGVVIMARNGAVIRHDPSGLVMRLSDKVIADIARRIGLLDRPADAPAPRMAPAPDAPVDMAMMQPAVGRPDPDVVLAGIDAWDLRQDGDWLFFQARLPGRQGTRGFRRERTGGAIIADAPGPLQGILGIGGARAALASLRPSRFPHHVLAPADDIGAVGHAACGSAERLNRLEALREMTHEALVAESLLEARLEQHAPLPLYMTRVETDLSPGAAELARGPAIDNLLVALHNLVDAAAHLGKAARLACICLDHALEETGGSATAWRDGMLALMDRIEGACLDLGLGRPLFISRLENETDDESVLAGQWELGWNHASHRFLFSAPAYMFAHDSYQRATDAGRQEMAEMTAQALGQPDRWMCPTFLLAEISPSNPRLIRLIARCQDDGGLVLDRDDPLNAGPCCGLRLLGAANGARITQVEIAPDDPRTLHLHLDRAPEGDMLRIAHAWGQQDPAPDGWGRSRSAIRDAWSHRAATGRMLHRWALPCLLPVTPGGQHD